MNRKTKMTSPLPWKPDSKSRPHFEQLRRNCSVQGLVASNNDVIIFCSMKVINDDLISFRFIKNGENKFTFSKRRCESMAFFQTSKVIIFEKRFVREAFLNFKESIVFEV